ncbi:MAG: sigma-54 dependent transcriptional regulator [Gammaproteobacteria bacterium]|nr:sigma-54 dependent transcriptional regulator [Gammaproteobacteria bacterium]
MQTVLIIDDNDGVRTALEMLFSIHGVRVLTASSPDQGTDLLATEPVDLVIQDMNFTQDTTGGDEGVALFGQIRRVNPELPVILLTAWGNLETAVELVRAGAADYLEKPWDDTKLLTTARNLLQLSAVQREKRQIAESRARARDALAEKFDLCGIVYRSDAMHYVVGAATQVAHADVPVLITGPNGAGKEKLAEIVQANSGCAAGPFIKVNVGALPAELMEAELFGAEAGAYTGANRQRLGRFEAADGGTLFLDEIATLPPEGQAKLLRVLQTGEFERLGSNRTRKVTVRVISATNADLKNEIANGAFREDLFYRLNVIELAVPPLSERQEDVLPLAMHFIDDEHEFGAEALRVLERYPWPGNVRELQNCIKRACLLAPGPVIGIEDLRLDPGIGHTAGEPDENAVRSALEQNNGVVAKAARSLGMSRQALYRRMEKYGIGPA